MFEKFLLILFLFTMYCTSSPFIEQKEQDCADQPINHTHLKIFGPETINNEIIHKGKAYPLTTIQSLTISNKEASGKTIVPLIKKMTNLIHLDISKTATSVKEICEIIKTNNCPSLTLSERFFLIKFNDPDVVLNLRYLKVVTPYRSIRPERLFNNFSDLISNFVRLTNAGNRLPSLKTFCFEVFYCDDEVLQNNEPKRIMYPNQPSFKKRTLDKKAKLFIETALQLSKNLRNVFIVECIYYGKSNDRIAIRNVYHYEKTSSPKVQESISGAG